MKRLQPFAYFEPASVEETIEILGEKKGACLLAGGTDLLVRMKRREICPHTLVNLKHIDSLDQIVAEDESGFSIGALTSIETLQNSMLIRKNLPIVAQAAGTLGAPSIRNLATIGGNIGRASPASDMAPALIVLQAAVTAQGAAGSREISMDDIFVGPGTTKLSATDMITSFFIPKPAAKTGAVYLKLGRRSGGGDCALVGVAALLTIGNDHIGNARIALSSVGPKPMRAAGAEKILKNGPLNDRTIREAARAAADGVDPITDMRCSASYRKEMTAVLTYRALHQALDQAKGGMPK